MTTFAGVDPERQEQAARFSWERTAREVIEVYEEAARK